MMGISVDFFSMLPCFFFFNDVKKVAIHQFHQFPLNNGGPWIQSSFLQQLLPNYNDKNRHLTVTLNGGEK